jgi:hypothetical protein
MRTLQKIGFVLLVVVGIGLVIALLSADTEAGRAFDEPGIPGKFPVQFALGFAVILGWVFGAGIEELWREDPDWGDLTVTIGQRLFFGVFLFFALIGAEIAFEALGIGLGSG